jgi:predicted transcriptional regulator
MKKSVTITARVTPTLDRKLAAFAKAAKRTKSQAIEIILNEHIDYEIRVVEAILEGIRSAEEEGTIPHEEVMRRLKAKSTRFRRAMRKKAA